MDHAFGVGRHQLAVAVEQGAVRPDHHHAVVQRAAAETAVALVEAADDGQPVTAGRFAQGFEVAAGEVHGVGLQLRMQLAGQRPVPSRRQAPDPRRVAGDEQLRQDHQRGVSRCGLVHRLYGPGERGLAIEQHRWALDDGNDSHGISPYCGGLVRISLDLAQSPD
ncbi:hypothetical protein D9M68_792990 [compost metagenome]